MRLSALSFLAKKKRFICVVAFGIYLAWVLVLHFFILEGDRRGVGLPAIYGLPIAVEMARPEARDRNDFCLKLTGKRDCKPLSPETLTRHLESGRYTMANPPRAISPGYTPKPYFVMNNRICNTRHNSIGVSCLTAYEASGPNGEEFFLCWSAYGRCFISELTGVTYPRG